MLNSVRLVAGSQEILVIIIYLRRSRPRSFMQPVLSNTKYCVFLSTRDGHCSREQKYKTRCLVRLILSSKLIKYLVATYNMSVNKP